MPPGTLFVVATPIGNLEDLTFRALRTLREVDLIAAEDTRRTSKLLARYEIRKPLVSLRQHNEHRESDQLVQRMKGGEHIALVSDAGTPGISDPGAPLVRAARDAGLQVLPVPGPSAIAASLSISGIEFTEFAFMGFPPRAGTERDEWMARLKDEPRTTVFFEAPHRIERTLSQIADLLAERPIYVNREITKIHEQLYIYQTCHAAPKDPVAGEFTVVIGPAASSGQDVDPIQCFDIFCRITKLAGFSDDEAVVMTAASLGTTSSTVRKIVKKTRISVKQQNQSGA
jgi:16S rRNA (cytidine1402-2'-O)-methyltransferase